MVSTEAGGCRPALAGLRPAISGVSSEVVKMSWARASRAEGGSWCCGAGRSVAGAACGARRSWGELADGAWGEAELGPW
jgi:hypothetical protein